MYACTLLTTATIVLFTRYFSDPLYCHHTFAMPLAKVASASAVLCSDVGVFCSTVSCWCRSLTVKAIRFRFSWIACAALPLNAESSLVSLFTHCRSVVWLAASHATYLSTADLASRSLL